MGWIRDHDALLWALGAVSLLTFVGTLVLLPVLVARIPADYFVDRRRHPVDLAARHPGLRLALRVLKNVLGLVLILAGTAMLVMPGQGVLTIVMGIVLADFPGKYRLERWLIRRRRIAAAVNWMRRRAGRPPLVPPRADEGA